MRYDVGVITFASMTSRVHNTTQQQGNVHRADNVSNDGEASSGSYVEFANIVVCMSVMFILLLSQRYDCLHA